MNISEVNERIDNIVQLLNGDDDYVLADQIQQFLELIEVQFGITLDAKTHEISNLFETQYHDIAIKKIMLIDFINDLVEVNIKDHVEELVNSQSWAQKPDFDGYSMVTSSPLLKFNNNNDTITIQQNKLNDHLSSRISNFNEYLNESPKGTSALLGDDESIKTELVSSSFFSFFVNIFNKCLSIILTSNQSLIILNSILISVLSTVIIFQNFELKFNIYPIIYKTFIYPTSKDLYWWQKIPQFEPKIWTFLDYIKMKDQNSTLNLKKSLI